jgi:hypothetical protein
VGFGEYWKTARQALVAHLGGGGEDILLCNAADVFDVLGVRLSFRMAASAAPVLNCMDDCRRAPSLPVIEREGRGAGFQRSPKAGSGDKVFASRSLGRDPQTLSFLRNGEEGRNGDDGRNLGEEGMLMSGVGKEAAVRLLEAENRAQLTEAAMFQSITRLELFLERIWRVVFRFLSTRHTLGDS